MKKRLNVQIPNTEIYFHEKVEAEKLCKCDAGFYLTTSARGYETIRCKVCKCLYTIVSGGTII